MERNGMRHCQRSPRHCVPVSAVPVDAPSPTDKGDGNELCPIHHTAMPRNHALERTGNNARCLVAGPLMGYLRVSGYMPRPALTGPDIAVTVPCSEAQPRSSDHAVPVSYKAIQSRMWRGCPSALSASQYHWRVLMRYKSSSDEETSIDLPLARHGARPRGKTHELLCATASMVVRFLACNFSCA